MSSAASSPGQPRRGHFPVGSLAALRFAGAMVGDKDKERRSEIRTPTVPKAFVSYTDARLAAKEAAKAAKEAGKLTPDGNKEP
jgi:hypothetical protein